MKDPKSFVKLFDLNVPVIEHLDYFIDNDKLYFGVYGPAGSGKSFTIENINGTLSLKQLDDS